jgi:hypothetical protein
MKNKKMLASLMAARVLAVAGVGGTAYYIGHQSSSTTASTVDSAKVSKTTTTSESAKYVATALENATNGDLSKNPNLSITAPGTYEITGSTTEGQLTVNVQDEDEVVIVLNNASLSNSSVAPINIINGKEVKIETLEGTTNTISGTGNDSETTATI